MDPTQTCQVIIDALMRGHFDDADTAAAALVAFIESPTGSMPAQGYLNEILEIVADSLEPIDGLTGLEVLCSNAARILN